MEESKHKFYGRQKELHELQTFFSIKGPGFTHLRGRRRIGKTELLKKIQRDNTFCFYFMGRYDESNRETLKRFAREWDAFTQEKVLTRLKISELNWDECFLSIKKYLKNIKKGVYLILLFDEIQWLAKKGVGFTGLLKEHWVEWKQIGKIKVIISGSSNRFFHQFTDGDIAILRGLKTHSTIWVRPFSLAEVKQYYFPQWKDEEICLIYMMIGGVPYYLENVRQDTNFIRAVNISFFCKSTIFLEEVEAMLKLETSTIGSRSKIKQILGCLGQDGATEATIVKKTKLTQDYVHKTIDRLLDYELIFEQYPLGTHKNNRGGVRYYMEDFYLNFYFQILKPNMIKIKGNENNPLFSEIILDSQRGYYIPNFTGKAFELLILYVIKGGCDNENERTQSIFQKLALQKGEYKCGTYWIQNKIQVDIIVEGLMDRELRIIEAKWVSSTPDASEDFVNKILEKDFENKTWKSWRKKHYIITSKSTSSGLSKKAKKCNVSLLLLSDLF